VTYEGFAATLPSVTDEVGFAGRMNTLPKFVASTSLKEPLAWNASLLTGDVPHEVMTLKEQPGHDILVSDSGTLVRFLIEHERVDVCRLMLHPILLGRGKRLFEDDAVRARLPLRIPRRPARESSLLPTSLRDSRRRVQPSLAMRSALVGGSDLVERKDSLGFATRRRRVRRGGRRT
jgi:dihydrofolate reductase